MVSPIYDMAMDRLGLSEGSLTPEGFADLYELVTGTYDEYDAASQRRDILLNEIDEIHEAEPLFPRKRPLTNMSEWFFNKVVSGESITLLSQCLEARGYKWERTVRVWLANGKSGGALHRLLPDPEDWDAFYRWIHNEENDSRPSYRAVRRYLGVSADKSPHGRSVQILVDRLGGVATKDDGTPLRVMSRTGTRRTKKVGD